MTATSSTASGVPMDSRIWRHLPQGLVDRVLAFLPPPAFFRFRSVCKRWYSLLFSDSFLEAHLRLSPGLPWLAFFLLPPRPPLLYSPSAAGPPSLLLLNPLSKLSSHLPPSPTPRLFPSVGLAAGPSSLSVVLAGDDLISPFAVKNLTAECFHADGATGFYSPWATASALPRLCNIDPGRMAFAAGRFYCMSCGPFAVLAYDVASNAWCKIQPPMRRFLRSPSLAECGGRVLLVAAVEKSRLSVPRSVRLWALQPCGRAWAEVERMPQEVYVRFSEAEAGRGFECVGNAEFMAITIKGSTDVLLFDFYRKEWRWAPPCPFIRGAAGGALRGFAYEPRLATPAIGLLDSSSSMPFQGFNG
ncbi:Protein UNUSUAL FLORAL ORGANS [Cocos nucifera]|nr:Protein UNUSUAL FLORAL ORGANS [Cocos nucifera]